MSFFGLRETQPAASFGRLLAGLVLLVSLTAVAEEPTYVPPSDPAEDYLQAIDRVEADFGPYATELSDLYLGLAQTLVTEGEFLEAKDAYNRGLMVLRVNSGPNSPEQTDSLFLLANIEVVLGDMSAAVEVLKHVYHINVSNYGEQSPEMLPVLDRIYGWYSAARPPGSLMSDYYDYERRLKLAEKMVSTSEAVHGEGHPATADAYRRLGDCEFQMVRHLTGTGMSVNPDHYVAMTSGALDPLGFGSGPVVEHADAGRRAYVKALKAMQSSPSVSAVEYADTLASLGDWYLLFEKARKSRELYYQALKTLQLNEKTAPLADTYMAQPQPMHFVANTEDEIGDNQSGEHKPFSLDISMTVTTHGEARKVTVLNPPEGLSEDDIRAIEMRVKNIPFRPAVKDGKVVVTEGFIWQLAIPAPEVAS